MLASQPLGCAGYAFSTYGEIVACWVQDIVLALLIVRFKWVMCACGLLQLHRPGP